MARWLQDAETGEYFQEDELDPNSYESVSDWQSLDNGANDAAQYEYPKWLTDMPVIGSVPARALGSLGKGAAGLERLLGDPFGTAEEDRKRALDLINQARSDSGAEPGSFQDVAATVGGEALAMLPTLGGGLAYNAARGVGRGLGNLYLAALPAALPAGDRYATYREDGIEPIPAALGAGANFVLDTALNKFDVAQILKPGAASLGRAGTAATVGGLTNVAGAYGGAQIDRAVGAPQTPEEFQQNLIIQGLAGAGTTGALSLLPGQARVSGEDVGPQGKSVEDFEAGMMADAPSPEPDLPPVSEFDGLAVPPAFVGGNKLTLDSDLPIIDAVPQQEPLIQVEEGYRARDLAGRQREIDDMFYPEDSELASLRQSPPTSPQDVIDIQRLQPSGKPIVKTIEDMAGLSPEERQAASYIMGTSPDRVARAQISENQAVFDDLMSKRDEARKPGRERYSTTDKELVIKVGDDAESFPTPIVRSLAEATERPISDVVLPPGAERSSPPGPMALAPQRVLGPQPEVGPLVEPVDVYRGRGPAQTIENDPLMQQIDRLSEGSQRFVPDSEVPIIGQSQSPVPAPDIIAPDAPASGPGQVVLDPTSDIAQARAAGQRLISGQRQQASPIEVVEGYDPKATSSTLPRMSRPKTSPGDQMALFPEAQPEARRKAQGQRLANRRKAPVRSSEAGFINLEDVLALYKGALSLFNKGTRQADDLTGFKAQSPTNQRYSGEGLLGPWRKHLEWMDTTMKQAPQSKGFIEAHWRIPQDMNAMVHDASETLKPYTSLTEAEMGPVNRFLVAARRKGPQGFKITKDVALKLGLTEKQADAALAVNQWSKQMLNELYAHAVAGEEHKVKLKLRSAKTPEAQSEIMTEAITKRKEIDDRFNDMLNTNYVPFNRYGEFYVRLRDAQGNVVESRRFEKKGKEFIAAKNHFDQLAKQNGGKIEFGQSDPNPLKRGEYQGVSPDILDILNDDAADVSTKGFYKHLKPIALIDGPNGKTRGVPGESDDLLRSIAEYTTGASKLIALQRAQRAGEIELATNLAGIDNANLNRRLLSWAEGFSKTDGKFLQGLNQAFNVAYIGGNFRTPTADILGKIHLQYSMLGKYLKGFDVEKTYLSTIPKEVMWWTQPAKFAAKHPELDKAIKEAQRKGIIPSTVYKGLLRKGRGRHNSASLSTLDTVHDAYFGLKAITEKSSDLSGFINGWEAYPKIAKNTPNGSRQQFAESFARETRAVPSQGELPATFKNPLVRTITKYQLYKAKILKNMMENGWDVRTRYLLATGMTTGLMGLPFVPNAITLFRTEGREPEAALRKAGLGDAAIYGPLSALSGIDLSSSAGFGEIFPGSGQDAIQKGILGMAQAPFDQFKRMRGYMDKGQDLQALAATPMMPNLLANIARGADWADRGVMTSSGQALIPQKDVTMRQVLARMAGWTPIEVRKEQTLNNIRKQAAYLAKDNDNINQRLGEAEALKKWDDVRELEAMARAKDIKINKSQVRKYRDAALGKKNLSVDSAPREIRQELKDWEKLFR